MKLVNSIFVPVLLLFTSCGASIYTVVDKNIQAPYTNPLFVLPYETITENFVYKVKEELTGQIAAGRKTGDILMLKAKTEKLTLNDRHQNEDTIDSLISASNHDLVIVFKPAKMLLSDNNLQSLSYIVVAVDVATKKEVWKGNLNSSSAFGPSMFSKKCARYVYGKLISDRVI